LPGVREAPTTAIDWGSRSFWRCMGGSFGKDASAADDRPVRDDLGTRAQRRQAAFG
jgi:hypothetical protein